MYYIWWSKMKTKKVNSLWKVGHIGLTTRTYVWNLFVLQCWFTLTIQQHMQYNIANIAHVCKSRAYCAHICKFSVFVNVCPAAQCLRVIFNDFDFTFNAINSFLSFIFVYLIVFISFSYVDYILNDNWHQHSLRPINYGEKIKVSIS